ncbi:MAG: hypothetical protein WD535_06145, partial [Thermaerobacterales bacterium]
LDRVGMHGDDDHDDERAGSWRVVAADMIRVFDFQQGFQIERRVFPQRNVPTDPPPTQETNPLDAN